MLFDPMVFADNRFLVKRLCTLLKDNVWNRGLERPHRHTEYLHGSGREMITCCVIDTSVVDSTLD